jgi:hypothetical protein
MTAPHRQIRHRGPYNCETGVYSCCITSTTVTMASSQPHAYWHFANNLLTDETSPLTTRHHPTNTTPSCALAQTFYSNACPINGVQVVSGSNPLTPILFFWRCRGFKMGSTLFFFVSRHSRTTEGRQGNPCGQSVARKIELTPFPWYCHAGNARCAENA